MTGAGPTDDAPYVATEPSFKPPRRRRKTVRWISVGVLGAIFVLLIIMAQVPDPDALASELAEGALAAMPANELTTDDLESAIAAVADAMELSPENESVRRATALLQQRAETQIALSIKDKAFDAAQSMLAVARTAWPMQSKFSEEGVLHQTLSDALAIQSLSTDIAERILGVTSSLDDSVPDNRELRTVLEQLRTALDIAPADNDLLALHRDVREILSSASSEALAAGELVRAQALLDTASIETEWADDPTLARLRDQMAQYQGERNRTEEISRLLTVGEGHLRRDRLSTPPGDNAVDTFQQVLALEPGNTSALSGLARVADRYAVLTRAAIREGDPAAARRLLGRMIRLFPGHVETTRLQTEIDVLESELAAVAAPTPGPVGAAVSAQAGEPDGSPVDPEPEFDPLPDDAEGLLWFAVKDSCEESELRRYIETYPAGRFIDEAWHRRSACMERRE